MGGFVQILNRFCLSAYLATYGIAVRLDKETELIRSAEKIGIEKGYPVRVIWIMLRYGRMYYCGHSH